LVKVEAFLFAKIPYKQAKLKSYLPLFNKQKAGILD
jgi:hypothetical protein